MFDDFYNTSIFEQIWLQRALRELNDDEMVTTATEILNSKFVSDNNGIKALIQEILLATTIEKSLVPLLAKLSKILADSTADSGNFSVFQNFLIDSLFNNINNTRMYFIYNLYKEEFISIDCILSSILKMDIPNDYAYLLIWFGPEFESTQNDAFNEISQKLNIEQFKSDDWKYVYEGREINRSTMPPINIFMIDDVDSISKFTIMDFNNTYSNEAWEPDGMLENKPSYLQLAAYYGAEKCYFSLLTKGSQATKCNANGVSILPYAIHGGNIRIIKSAIEYQVSFDGSTDMAIKMNRNELISYFYKKDGDNSNALVSCAMFNNFEALQIIMELYPDVLNQKASVFAAVVVAIIENHSEILKILVESSSFDINQAEKQTRFTPLMIAIIYNSIECVQYLLSIENINVDLTLPNNLSAVEIASLMNNVEILKLIIPRTKNTPLAVLKASIIKQESNTFEYLLHNNDFNSENSLRDEIMYKAIKTNITKLVDDLVQKGYYDPTRSLKYLLHAAESNSLDVLKYLSYIDDKPIPQTILSAAFISKANNVGRYLIMNNEIELNESMLFELIKCKNHQLFSYFSDIIPIKQDIQCEETGDNLLIALARYNFVSKCKELIENPIININHVNFKGESALTVTKKYKLYKIQRLLILDDRIKLDIEGYSPITSWIYAAYDGDLDVMKKLYKELKFNVNAPTTENDTALSIALEHNHYHIVEFLVSIPEIDANAVIMKIGTPLVFSIKNNDPKMVKVLVDSEKVDLNIKSSLETPISAAFKIGNNEIIKMLLSSEKMEYISKSKMLTQSPLSIAITSGNIEIINFILGLEREDVKEMIAKDSPLVSACKTGKLEIVKIFIEHGVDVNSTNITKETPLFAAINSRNMDIIKFLLEQPGINVNAQDNLKRTPYSLAKQFKLTQIMELLIEHGANPNPVQIITPNKWISKTNPLTSGIKNPISSEAIALGVLSFGKENATNETSVPNKWKLNKDLTKTNPDSQFSLNNSSTNTGAAQKGFNQFYSKPGEIKNNWGTENLAFQRPSDNKSIFGNNKNKQASYNINTSFKNKSELETESEIQKAAKKILPASINFSPSQDTRPKNETEASTNKLIIPDNKDFVLNLPKIQFSQKIDIGKIWQSQANKDNKSNTITDTTEKKDTQ